MSNKDREFSGRVVMITGAASGIGRSTSELFCRRGARVIGIDVQGDLLKERAAELDTFTPAEVDITNHSALAETVARTISDHDKIDILVNNAGIEIRQRAREATMEVWRKILSVNLEAMFELTRLVVPHMIERRSGRIVNVSSVQATTCERNVTAYAASKGGASALTRSQAIDLAEYGILVNAVAPGAINTPMNIVDGVDVTEGEEFEEKWLKPKVPLQRMGQPEEIADAIAFLSGDSSTYITGTTLFVDGGLTIRL